MIQTWEIVMGSFCILYWSILPIRQFYQAEGIFIEVIRWSRMLFYIVRRQQGEIGRWGLVCQPPTRTSPVLTTTVDSPAGDWKVLTRGFTFISFPTIVHTMSLDPWRVSGWREAWRVSMLRWIKRTDHKLTRLSETGTVLDCGGVTCNIKIFLSTGKIKNKTAKVF